MKKNRKFTEEEKHKLAEKVLGKDYGQFFNRWRKVYADIQDGWFDAI